MPRQEAHQEGVAREEGICEAPHPSEPLQQIALRELPFSEDIAEASLQAVLVVTLSLAALPVSAADVMRCNACEADTQVGALHVWGQEVVGYFGVGVVEEAEGVGVCLQEFLP